MALSFVGTLRDTSNKPLAGTKVHVSAYVTTGGMKTVASATTNASGAFSGSASIPISGYLPRLMLRATIGGKLLNISSTPKSYTSMRVDFGINNVSTKRTVVLSGTALYGQPTTVEPDASPTIVSKVAFDTEKSRGDKLNSDLKAAQSQVKSLNATNAQLNGDLGVSRGEVDKLNAEIAKLKQDSKTIAKPTLKTKAVTQDEILTGAADALKVADSRLESTQSRYRINKLSLNLKVLPGQDAQSFRLAEDNESLTQVDPRLLSDFAVDFDTRGVATPEEAGQFKLPSVVGYARSLAERKLAGLGVTVDVYEQQLTRDNAARAGQVLRQFPSPGTVLDRNATVQLIVGRGPS